MKLLQAVEDFIFQAPAWKLVLVIGAVAFFKVGIWFIPNLGIYHEIALDPFVNPFRNPDAHYLYWNWLGPFLFWLLGAGGWALFFLFHLVFSLAFTLLFLYAIFTRFSDRAARVSLILFVVLPVSTTAYYWVGMDSLTLFLMLLAMVFTRYSLLTLLIGVALGMQHFEQGFFASTGLLFAITLSRKLGDDPGYSVKFCLYLLVGVIVGKLTLLGIFEYHGAEVNSGRVYWAIKRLPLLMGNYFYHFHVIIWSALGLGWLVALKYADYGIKSFPLLLALSGLTLALSFVDDQTRVVAIVTFMLVTVYWLFNAAFLERIGDKEVSVLFLIWVLMPWGWAWKGEPKWSAFPYDIAYLLHKVFGWFNVPENFPLWPFLPAQI